MKIFGFEISKAAKAEKEVSVNADYGYGGASYNRPVWRAIWDGEKNQGETGPIIRYITDPYALRYRSEQLYKESEICRTIVDKTVKWVIDRGMKLNAAPKIKTLAANGITVDHETFSKPIEELWEIYANSTLSDYTDQMTLGEISADLLRRALVGGDVLVINRIGKDGFVKKQIIDGCFVVNPLGVTFNGADNVLISTGNRIRFGVEIDATGKHVAYHVRTTLMQTERIPAYGKNTGIRTAYLVYGVRDGERGVPLVSAIIEMAKKMERYMSASLAGAEARAQIDYFIETVVGGSQENAFQGRGAIASRGIDPSLPRVNDNLAIDVNGIALARQVQATTNHTTTHLPTGQTIKSVEGKQETNVPEFGGFIIDVMCAVCDIPPDVAMSKYNGSFSSSRMSAKDGERSFGIRRERFAHQDLDPTYEYQMYIWVNQNRVKASGYLDALKRNDQIVLQAYLFCRWVGSRMPDIDPLKTANAWRVILGKSFERVPLGTAEAAAEDMEQGSWEAIVAQVEEEYAATGNAGIPLEDPVANGQDESENEEGEEENPPTKKK